MKGRKMSTGRARPWQNATPLEGYQPRWAGQFDTFQDWVSYASHALSDGPIDSFGEPLKAICIDAKGRRCIAGKCFKRAIEEGAFPIRYFWDFTPIEDQQS